jgi:AcrR family transcriptional regulator
VTAAKAVMPRRRDLVATRRALVAAGADVFARRGFAAASLDEIAEAAGFTRGAVHHHFASKEELFLAVVEDRDEQLLAGYADDIRFPIDPSTNLARWRDLHGDGFVDVALRLELHAQALRNRGVRPLLAEVEGRAVAATAQRLADRAASAGVRWRYPVAQIAELLHVMSNGLLERSVVTGADVAPLMETFLTLVWHDAVENTS